MVNRTTLYRCLVLMAAACLLVARPAAAQYQFNVSLDTSGLMGNASGPFSLDFQLNDGSGTGDANNTATLSNFNFGAGGAPTGTPTLIGGAAGDLATTVELTDSDFLNEFTQGFTPGSLLTFDVNMTTNVDPGGTPDQFSMAILDNTGAEIPTLGTADQVLSVDIVDNNPGVYSFAADPARTPIALTVATITFAASAPVPEPGALGLLPGFALLGLSYLRRLRRPS